ncbi:MAG TPA: hypothetical protein VGN31_18910 [Paraburkholderia sp.]
MKGVDVRSMNISRPVQGLLVVAAGLAAFAYWKGHEAPMSTSHERNAPAITASATRPARAASRSEAAVPPASVSGTSASSGTAASARPALPAPAEAIVDVFPSQNWLPPPPPPPPVSAAPPPPPEPPPLPFVVRSLWLDQRGALYVVLSAAGKDFMLCEQCSKKGFLRAGDVLLNEYRIESVSEREVRFLYLPLKRRQQLSFGGGR